MGRRRPHQRRSNENRQLDLFGPGRTMGSTGTPAWTALPKQTRQTLTDLMTHLLVDHARGDPAVVQRESVDDV